MNVGERCCISESSSLITACDGLLASGINSEKRLVAVGIHYNHMQVIPHGIGSESSNLHECGKFLAWAHENVPFSLRPTRHQFIHLLDALGPLALLIITVQRVSRAFLWPASRREATMHAHFTQI